MELALVHARDDRDKSPRQGARFPRLPLFSALAFVGFAMAAIVFGQLTEIGTVRVELGQPAAMRDIVIAERGAQIAISDAASGETLAVYGPSEGGFVRGSLRALNRIRLVAEVPTDQPYRLIRWQNGAISLSDTGTGERLYLDAFGPDNSAAFGEFLNQGRSKR